MSGFMVDPEELGALAAEFDRIADQVDRVLNSFQTAAEPPAGTFGLLPAAREAHRRYLARAQEGVRGISSVHDGFTASLAGGIRTNAANYARADLGSVIGDDR